MNAIVNKLLLAGDKFMPGMHLRRSGFTYSACGPFTKKKKEKKTKETAYKACFQHNMTYGDFNDLSRTASDKVLRVKHLISKI